MALNMSHNVQFVPSTVLPIDLLSKEKKELFGGMPMHPIFVPLSMVHFLSVQRKVTLMHFLNPTSKFPSY